MLTLALEIDLASLQQYRNGTVAGIVFIQAGEVAFPERTWNDLAVMVATEWIHSVSQLAIGASWKERFHFLDGPFALDLALDERGRVHATLIDRRSSNEVIRGKAQADLSRVVR
jgi:hypothetical protein